MSKYLIDRLAEKYAERAIEDRRWFHCHAELSNREYQTSEYISRELTDMGLEVIRPTPTGVIAVLRGMAGEGPIVGLRADIDALPIQEENETSYCSQNPGVMHACGHDAHAAALLMAARMLNEKKEALKGTVKFIFQPAEEYFPSGAAALLESGELDDVDSFCGVHVMTNAPVGSVSVQSGAIMAGSCTIKIQVIGKGGHGGMPHTAVDATVAAAAILMNLQTYVSRELNPLNATVVSIGTFHSGTAINIISEKAEMAGTIRYFDPDGLVETQNSLRRIAECTAAAFGATSNVEFIPGLEATINDDVLTQLGVNVCEMLWGKSVLTNYDKSHGCDDFCYYGQRKPSLYVFFGAGNEKENIVYPHHNPHFEIDENSIINAAKFYTGFALMHNDR